MSSFLDDLLNANEDGRRESARARLRVAVSEALLIHMQESKVTKAQLAGLIGVTRSAISQALSGTRNLSLNTLSDICEALGLRPDVSFAAFESQTQTPRVGALRSAPGMNYSEFFQATISNTQHLTPIRMSVAQSDDRFMQIVSETLVATALPMHSAITQREPELSLPKMAHGAT